MGSELKTVFTIGAALWDDTDLPLTYQYYLVDPYDTTTTVAIRSGMRILSWKQFYRRDITPIAPAIVALLPTAQVMQV